MWLVLPGRASTHYFTLDAQTTDAGGAVTSQLDVTRANGGTINATTGAFSANAASFIEGAGSTGGIPALVHGRILSDGEGVAGLFTTTQTGTIYAGGFVGDVRGVATALDPVSGRKSGIGTLAERNLGSGTANGIAVVGDDYALLVADASAASKTTRNNAFLAGLSPTGFGATQTVVFADGITTHLEGRANTRTSGRFNSGGNNFPATQWTNFGGQAQLVLFDGSGVTGSGARGSFLVAGGAVRPVGTVLSGGFTWAGALVLGEADDLDGTPEIGRFTLRYDFASSDAVKGSLEGAFADVPGNGATTTPATIDVDVSIDAASGRITNNSAGTFALVAGATFDGVLAGYVSGAEAQGISGVFATNGATGTQYAGGFVGGAPQVASDLYTGSPATGYSIGQANRSVFSGNPHSAGRILFLGFNYAAGRDELNVASDTERNQHILSSLGVALTRGTAIGNITIHRDMRFAVGSDGRISEGTFWQDSNQVARLITTSGVGDGFFVAGGKALSGTLAGTYRYEGTFVSNESNAFIWVVDHEGTFSMSVNFTDSSFTFTGTTNVTPSDSSSTQTSRLVVTTGGTVNASTGVLLATAAAYTYYRSRGTTITVNARLDGRVLGGGGGAVAGVFTTTSALEGRRAHAGGFVGAAPQVASDLYTGSAATGYSIGQANRSVFSGTAHGPRRILFLGDNHATRRNGLNVASDTARNRQILSNLRVTATGGTAIGSLTKHTGVSVTHGSAGTTAQATIWQDSNQTARLFAFSDLFVAGGNALSGTLAGTYLYDGVFVSASGTALGTLREGTFTLSANFTGSSFTFTGTTNATPTDSSTTQTSRLAVTTGGTVDASTGVLLAIAAAYTEGTGTDKTANARLDGRILGAGGGGVAGLFTTLSGTRYVGGFVGVVRGLSTALDPVSGRKSGLGSLAGRNLGPNTASDIAVVGDDYARLIVDTTAASSTTRNNAFLAGLRPTGFGARQAVVFADGITTHLESRANTRTGGGYNSGGNFPATEWTNFGGQARLVLFDGSGVTGSGARGSFLAAGGAARPASTVLSGGFTWAGALVLGEADGLDGTPEIGRFTLRYNFASSHAVKGSLEGAFADVPGNGGTTTTATIDVDVSIDAASGRITNNSAGNFALVAGATFDGVLAGYVSGATAQGISGVFATSGATGTNYAGGFVGGAPILARDIANPANGLRIGTAREDVRGTSGHGRGSLFLSSSTATFDTPANALNVASDTLRGNALLANLRDALTGGAPVPDTGISKFTLSSSNKITYGSSEAATGVVFGDSDKGLRLVAVDGFIAAGGTLLTAAISGTFRYSGAFVSAASGSLGSALRSGTFDLVADLSGAANTHYFRLDAQTTDAGGAVTSQLDVTQANGETINATTGVFSSTAASFIEGAGSTGGITALVHGRILSAGEGVAGLFTTTQAGTTYAGGFVGGAPILALDIANPANGLRIGTAREGVRGSNGHGHGSLFLSSSVITFNTHLNALNVVSDTLRGNALLANLRDALTGGAPVPDTGISKYTLSSSNKITYGNSEAASGVVFGDSALGLRLVAVDGFIAAGGTLLTAAISGTFRYSGAFVSAASGSLGSALREGRFDLVADLSGAANTHYFTLDAQTTDAGGAVTSQLDVTQGNGGTIDAITGAFSATAASFIEGAGSGGGITALVHGRILSGGEGVAGLFTTTRAGTVYAGGFVGVGPILAQDIANPANGLRIGTAREDVIAAPVATGANGYSFRPAQPPSTRTPTH